MPVEIHGRTYITVAERLRAFRSDFPASLGWSIQTNTNRTADGTVVARTKIISPLGQVVATGTAERTKEESVKLGGRTREFAETGSVGRALIMFGVSVEGDEEIASADDLAFLEAEGIDLETEYMPRILQAIRDEDAPGMRELWSELSDHGKGVIWRLMDSHKKGVARKLLAASFSE